MVDGTVLPFGKPLEAMSIPEFLRHLEILEVNLGNVMESCLLKRAEAEAAGDAEEVYAAESRAASYRATQAQLSALRASVRQQAEA